MATEFEIQEKLQKILTLFAQTTTPGERATPTTARERARNQIQTQAEWVLAKTFFLKDPWMTSLFRALAQKQGLRSYPRRGKHRLTVLLVLQRIFLDPTLWPEFLELGDALESYSREAVDQIIQQAVYADTSDPDVRSELKDRRQL